MVLLNTAKELSSYNEIKKLYGKGAKNVVGLTRPAKAHFEKTD